MAKIYGLEPRQLLFCYEYLRNKFNGTAAAIAAGYSAKTAEVQASRLLSYAKIKQAIEKLTQDLLQNTTEDARKVIQELQRMAYTNLSDCVTWDESGKVKLKSSDDLGAANSAVREIEIDFDEEPPEKYGDKPVMRAGKIKLKLHDKNKPLELLGKHLALFTENVNMGGGVTVTQQDEPDLSHLSDEELREYRKLQAKVRRA